MNTYELCKKLAVRGRLTSAMLDVYFAAGRLTAEQYAELIAMTPEPTINERIDNLEQNVSDIIGGVVE